MFFLQEETTSQPYKGMEKLSTNLRADSRLNDNKCEHNFIGEFYLLEYNAV
jgi:hypothetical protein